MRNLSDVLNESFRLYEKTSEIRKYHIYEEKPPVWYDKALAKPGMSSYDADKACSTMLLAYSNGAEEQSSYSLGLPKWVAKKLEVMRKAYLEEYIDLDKIPCSVIAGMLDDIINDPKNWASQKDESKPWLVPVEMYRKAKTDFSVTNSYIKDVNDYRLDVFITPTIRIIVEISGRSLPLNPSESDIRNAIDAKLIKKIGKPRFELVKNYKIDLPA